MSSRTRLWSRHLWRQEALAIRDLAPATLREPAAQRRDRERRGPAPSDWCPPDGPEAVVIAPCRGAVCSGRDGSERRRLVLDNRPDLGDELEIRACAVCGRLHRETPDGQWVPTT